MKFFSIMALISFAKCTSAFEFTTSSGDHTAAVCDCADNVCALVPPKDAQFPCYQGSNEDASKCFKTDPLLKDGTTWACGTCSTYGYPNYERNDPVMTSHTFPFLTISLSTFSS
jgi:hypothetical protein